jgi:8-oxo-dGTP pyrophosphatase MutT (NUDIX family)
MRLSGIFLGAGARGALVGSPPPLGRGSGRLYLLARESRLATHPWRVLLIHELRGPRRGTWGPPGGLTDRTDASPLDAALREFNEETGATWQSLANFAGADFQLTRLQSPRQPPKPDEDWFMTTGLGVAQSEQALFGVTRSLAQSVRARLSHEVCGYAWLPIDEVSAVVNTGSTTTTAQMQHGGHAFRFHNFRVPRKVGEIGQRLP